jgi:hypothetical protein
MIDFPHPLDSFHQCFSTEFQISLTPRGIPSFIDQISTWWNSWTSSFLCFLAGGVHRRTKRCHAVRESAFVDEEIIISFDESSEVRMSIVVARDFQLATS